MNIFLRILVVAALVLMCNSTFAHEPNEIYYSITANNQKKQLIIRFTPVAATNLLYYLKPELKSETEVSLADYVKDFETYFNKTIDLKIDKQSIQFVLNEHHNLQTHEAMLVFALKDIQTYDSEFEITVSSYLDFNDKVLNVVRVDLDGEKTNCILGKNSKTCSSTNKVNLSDSILVLVAIGLLLAVYFLTRKKKRS